MTQSTLSGALGQASIDAGPIRSKTLLVVLAVVRPSAGNGVLDGVRQSWTVRGGQFIKTQPNKRLQRSARSGG